MISPCLNLMCYIGVSQRGFWQKTENYRQTSGMTWKKEKKIPVFLGKALCFAMNRTHRACSTFIPAKELYYISRCIPKEPVKTRSLLFNPHTSLFSWRISTTLLIRLYLDLLCKHTFLTHAVLLQSLMASVLKMRGLQNLGDMLLYSQPINIPRTCWLMKHCYTHTPKYTCVCALSLTLKHTHMVPR